MSDDDPLPSAPAPRAELAGALRELEDLEEAVGRAGPVAWLDAAGVVLRANHGFARVTGLPPDELVGRDLRRLVHVPDDFEEALRSSDEDVWRGELRVGEPGDDPRWLRATVAAIRVRAAEDRRFVAIMEDVTAQRTAERRFRGLFERAGVGIALVDRDDRIVEANAALADMLGAAPEELAGTRLREHCTASHDGTVPRLLDELRDREVESLERLRQYRGRGGEARWGRLNASVVRDPGGEPELAFATLQDVTDAVEAEASLKRREAQAQVGQMAGVVAHDVRNALAGIGGALQIIQSRLPDDSMDREIMAEVQDRLGSLNRVVTDLLLVARPLDRVRFEPTSLRQILESVRADAEDLGARVELSGPDIALRGDRAMLEHLFRNLYRNAAEAMGGGTLRVTIASHAEDCEVRVADEGPGIPPETLPQVTEPFVTTKSKGTGLGLTIARRAAEEVHGGSLDVTCPPEGGTVVTVTLPIVTLTFPSPEPPA